MNHRKSAPRFDVYQQITDKIVAALEKGVRPWSRSWNNDNAMKLVTKPLRFNDVPYQGINVLVLWLRSMELEECNAHWMTFRQALKLGGAVRKGEKGETVTYASKIVKKEIDEATGEEEDVVIPFLKAYTVFNTSQIDGLDDKYYSPVTPTISPEERVPRAERWFANLGADIRERNEGPYYAPRYDYINVPPFVTFDTPDDYYSTLAHECVHWTKHKSRLDRRFDNDSYGGEGYAFEELVAELGAAFVCSDLVFAAEPREDHARYIKSWLKVLDNDKRAIFRAAAWAQKACDFLHGLQEPKEPLALPAPAETPSVEPVAEAPAPVREPLPVVEISADWNQTVTPFGA